MSKDCLECGKSVPDDAKFCPNCGYSFEVESSPTFNTNTLFLIIIIAAVIIGAAFIVTSGGNDKADVETADPISLTITDVNGWDSDDSSKKSYTLYTEALFDNVPDDKEGYLIKTVYYDNNNTQIGHTTEKLDYVYYDSDYALSFGHYTTYAKPNPSYVVVELIKDGKVINNYTEQIDTSKIDYLN